MKKSAAGLALFAFLALGAPAFAAENAFSEFPEAVDKPVVIQLAGVWNSFDTQAALSVSRGGILALGTTVDMEKLFGVPVTQMDFRADGTWQISRRNYIEFGYAAFDRSGARSLEGDVVWNGFTYKAGLTVEGKFNNTYAYVGWHYDILRSDNIKVWMGLSVAYEHFEMGLNGSAFLTDPNGTVTGKTDFNGISVGVPAPLLGIGVKGALSKNWTMDFYLRAIGFSSADIGGSVFEAGLSFGWYPWKNVGFVGGADYTKFSLTKYKTGDETVRAVYFYAGPRLGLVVGF
ncbi:MAG TPA: hypothetical protein VMH79_00060 [Thermoanaerobaculia bacterium]|nr:hypothetical protein [Thermoanaerobaculia bacterium]